MYVPAAFAAPDDDAVAALIAAYPLATLVTGDLHASPLPLRLVRDGDALVLRGHLARANQHTAALHGQAALAIFTGPQAYVSPSYYPSKAAHGRVVPTWNYVTVHAHGTAHLIDDATWVRDLVTALTDDHERHRGTPWAVSDAPTDYLDGMMRAIVGVELRDVRLVGKWKLSQNRSAVDRGGVADGLAAGSPDEQACGRLIDRG